MLNEHLGSVVCERAVQKDLPFRDLALGHQHADVVQKFLRALDREGGDQEIAARLMRIEDFTLQCGSPLFDRRVLALAVAIGAFAKDIIEACGRIGLEVKDLLIRGRDRLRTACGRDDPCRSAP